MVPCERWWRVVAAELHIERLQPQIAFVAAPKTMDTKRATCSLQKNSCEDTGEAAAEVAHCPMPHGPRAGEPGRFKQLKMTTCLKLKADMPCACHACHMHARQAIADSNRVYRGRLNAPPRDYYGR